MKTFIIEVPKGNTECKYCMFCFNDKLCKHLSTSKLCSQYNFNKMDIIDDRQMQELANTEFDYGHNVSYKEYYEE